jgi:very-short-patch-repair endonuclease
MFRHVYSSKEPTQHFAHLLRTRMTSSEKLLWKKVRSRQCGWKFRRQVPIGPYIVDFLCPEGRLIIEIDGSSHEGAEKIAYDARRDFFLLSRGFYILRFGHVATLQNIDGVIERILDTLSQNIPIWREEKGENFLE